MLGAPKVEATHFRFATYDWSLTANPGEVIFELTAAFRRNGYPGSAIDGHPQIGDIIFERIGDTEFDYGDGQSTATLEFIVTAFSPSENWIIGRALDPGTRTPGVRHTYTAPGPFLAGIQSCCRISNLNNSPDGDYNVRTLVTPFGNNEPPTTTLVPIVSVARGSASQFLVPASDPEGDFLRFRLANSLESGNAPSTPPGFSINAATGVITWNNIGLDALNPWTAQVLIEDIDNLGNVKSRTPVDFLMMIITSTNNTPPTCSIDPPGPFDVIFGNPITFTVTAQDTDAGDTLTINSGGLPIGATMSPGLPTSGATGVSSSFEWTPGIAQAGTHVVQFSITDAAGAQSLCSVTINVLISAAPNLFKNYLVVGTNVSIGEQFTYELSFNTYSNTAAAENLRLVDFLPIEVDFISATQNGATNVAYDPVAHTVTWSFGTWPPLSAGPTNYLTIRVNTNALGGGNVVNLARLLSDNLQSVTTRDRNPRCPTCPPGITVTTNETVQTSARMTGGGSIIASTGAVGVAVGGRVTHGFQLRCAADAPSNRLEVNWKDENGDSHKFHLETLATSNCADDPAIAPAPPPSGFDTFTGTGSGRYDGVTGATATWTFTDAGEPGNADTGRLEIRDAAGSIVLQVHGSLRNGNHQAHVDNPPASSPGPVRIATLLKNRIGNTVISTQGRLFRVYTVESSTDLRNWTVLGIQAADSGGTLQYEDNDGTAPAVRFYRLLPW